MLVSACMMKRNSECELLKVAYNVYAIC